MSRRPPSVLVALFRALLRLHPRAFRARWEADLFDYLTESWREQACTRGPRAAAAFWLRAFAGVVVTATRQRLGGRAPADGRLDPESARVAGRGGALGVDLLHAARALARRPAFTAVTILTLALGMGANAAVFSVLHSVLLAPLAYPEPDRLVRLYQSDPERPGGRWFLPGASFLDYRESLTSIEALAAVYDYSEMGADLMEDGRSRRVAILPVSSDYFQVLRVRPLVGRTFTRDEEHPGAQVAVVSEPVWRRALDADPDLTGRTLELDGVSRAVVGVLPLDFADPLHGGVEVWLPDDLTDPEVNEWANNRLTVIGRLAPGATLEQARAEIGLRSAQQAEVSARSEEDIGAGQLVSLKDDLAGPAEPMLLAVMGAVTLLLLITCVNVASLLLARGVSRQREMAVRTALGSGRSRLVRLLVLESLLLSVGGAALGLVIGVGVQEALISLAPAALPRQLVSGYGVPAVLFGASLSVVVGLALAVLPAWQLSRANPANAHGAARAGDGAVATRTRQALVVCEVALAVILLVGAGLLVQTLDRLRSVPLGFEPRNVWTFQVNLPDARYDEPVRRTLLHDALEERISTLPGVEAVGAVSRLPATGPFHPWGAQPVGAGAEARVPAQHRVISGDYFAAMGIGLVTGRLFNAEDRPGSPRTAVVSESLARQLFPAGAVGQRINGVVGIARDLEIVGVVEDVALTPEGVSEPVVYHAHAQVASNRNWTLTQVVRTRAPLAALPELARTELARIDPELVVHQPRAMDTIVGAGSARQRFAGVVLTAFAGLALLLASLGVYGVLAFSVAQRRREIGVRIALGARALQVGGTVLRGGLGLTAAGVALGLLGALALGRALESLLFEVSARDPLVFAAAPLLVIATGLLASWVPARRATTVDPAESLREE